MTFNDRLKIFKRTAARQGMFGSYWLVARLPYGVVKILMHFFIAVGFLFTVRLKKIARESLETAFGSEKTPAEITQIVRDCFSNFGKGMIEMIYFSSHPEKITENVWIEGREHLDDALKNGKGVIAVSAHFGNFPLMMLAMAQYGYRGHVLMRHTRDPKIDAFLLQKRTQLGLGTIFTMPRRECVHNCLKVLRNNEILYILMDQNFGGDGGVFVDFFGQKAATATGPVVLAQRMQSGVVIMLISRQPDGRHKIHVDPPFDLERDDDGEKMIYSNVARLTKTIEGYIRKQPHEWGWMHRRWKSKSAEGQESAVAYPHGSPGSE